MSSINPNNVDGTYPIAGQDNDSQGFRDNFTNIKNNFQFAYDELADLQSKAILKGALSGGTLNNDMAYSRLISPQLIESVETPNDLGTKNGTFAISWADGHFQYYTTDGNTTLSFSNWPTSGYYTRLRLQITTDTVNRTVTFPAAVSVGLTDVQGASGQVVTFPTAGVYLFELTTVDNGTTITIQDLLRNYDIVTTGSSGAFTSLNVSGNVLATGAKVFGNATLGLAGVVSGQFHSVVGNITQTSSGGAVYINTTGNVLAAGIVGSSLTVNGNLSSTATHVETGYQQSKPTANVAITVNANVNRVLIHPTGTITGFGANVTLPNVQVDGTIINISSNVNIVALDVRPNWNGVVAVSPSGNAAVTAGSNTRYMYIAADYVWYKID